MSLVVLHKRARWRPFLEQRDEIPLTVNSFGLKIRLSRESSSYDCRVLSMSLAVHENKQTNARRIYYVDRPIAQYSSYISSLLLLEM